MNISEFLRHYGNVKFKCSGHLEHQAYMRLDKAMVCVNECDELIVENMPMDQIQPLINRIIDLPAPA